MTTQRREGWEERAARHAESPPRCPRCRALETEWLPSGGLGCLACERDVKVEDHSAWRDLSSWENALAAHPSAWSDYFIASPRSAERAEPEWQALLEVIDRERRTRNARDFKAIVGLVHDSIGPQPSEVEIVLIWAMSLLLWGLPADEAREKMKGRAWYRRDPKRPAFGRVGAALNFAGGLIGVGPVNLEIAETKVHARAGGFRSGVVHAKGSSRNGSTGGVKGAAGVDRAIDVANAIRRSGVSDEDAALVAVVYGDPDAKPDRKAAAERVLEHDGRVGPPSVHLDAAEQANRDRLVAAAMPTVSKRVARAQRALERAMRLPAPNAPPDWEEAALLPPGRATDVDPKPATKGAPPEPLEPTTSTGLES